MMRLTFLLAFAASLVVSAAAQPTGPAVLWERVGVSEFDNPDDGHYEVRSVPAFAADGYLYAFTGVRYPSGTIGNQLSRLPPPHDSDALWETVYYDILFNSGPFVAALGADTLLVATGGSAWRRSTDGGTTFSGPISGPDYVGSSAGFGEIQAGPYAGTLVTMDNASYERFAGYSRDRGATWARAPNPTPDAYFPASATRLTIVQSGPRAGRVVIAGSQWGLSVSDDGGASYQLTDVWGEFALEGYGVLALAGAAPDGGDRLVAFVNSPTRLLGGHISDDGGDTWRPSAPLPVESANDTRPVTMMDLGGGRAVALSNFGQVFETTDAGESWTRREGVLPYSIWDGSQQNPIIFWAKLGPDGRLYVGGARIGPPIPGNLSASWMWRTVEPYATVAVAGEASPETGAVGVTVSPNPGGGALTVRVDLPAPSALSVSVFDTLGRRVAVLHDGPAASAVDLAVDTSGWPAGIYVAVVTAGSARTSARFTVVR